MRAYIGVGTNLGDLWGHLQLARRELERAPGVELIRASRVYDTAPLGPAQPRYLNAVLEVETELPPEDVLTLLLRTEEGALRSRDVRWGARTLDLDLLLYGDLVVRSPTLTLPHPGLMSRKFVLGPLAELCPQQVVPGTGDTVAELLRRVPEYDMKLAGLYPE